MIGLTEQRQQELIKWLEEEIAAYKSARDEIPFGLAADESNVLDSYIISLFFLKKMNFDEWIDWQGGLCPVPATTLIEPKLRSGKIMPAEVASYWEWRHRNYFNDIVAYRVVKV